MEFPHILKVELGQSQGSNGGVSGDEIASFTHQVHHDHGGIETM
jgi:hypothetical protein